MIQAKLLHLKLSVKNLEESVEFYKKVFSQLGFVRGRYWDDPYDKQKTYTLGNENMYLELVEDPSMQKSGYWDEKTISGPRIEFNAISKDEVDKFYKHLFENNVDIIEKPKQYYDEIWESEGMKDVIWYGVYFQDNNGIKFGLVHTNDF
jgi:predicted lactoylglutathione lyase